jgi:hypothetical protein
MVQGRRRTRLAPETLEGLRIFCHVIWQKLQSNKAAEFVVLGLVDDTHAATAELLDDSVVRNVLADHSRRMLRPRQRQVNEGVDVDCVPNDQLAKNRVAVEKLFRPKIAKTKLR